jgi:hypothetical protein
MSHSLQPIENIGKRKKRIGLNCIFIKNISIRHSTKKN